MRVIHWLLMAAFATLFAASCSARKSSLILDDDYRNRTYCLVNANYGDGSRESALNEVRRHVAMSNSRGFFTVYEDERKTAITYVVGEACAYMDKTMSEGTFEKFRVAELGPSNFKRYEISTISDVIDRIDDRCIVKFEYAGLPDVNMTNLAHFIEFELKLKGIPVLTVEPSGQNGAFVLFFRNCESAPRYASWITSIISRSEFRPATGNFSVLISNDGASEYRSISR